MDLSNPSMNLLILNDSQFPEAVSPRGSLPAVENTFFNLFKYPIGSVRGIPVCWP